MATESAVRLIGRSGPSNWPLNKDAVILSSSTTNVAAQELGFLLDGPRFHEDTKVTGPNRCGSAPPSIEGSLLAAGNLIDQQNSSLDGSLENLTLAVESCNSEEQLRSHPAYLAYYCSNVNLNPRLPPPLISQENRRLVHHIGGFTDNWRMPSFDDSYKGCSFISRSVLSTHKEEPEDDMSPRVESDDWTDKSTGFLSQRSTSPLQGRHKTIMDIIQEDFPRTPSPVYRNQSRLLDHTGTEQTEQDGLIRPSRDLEQETGKVGGRICTPKPFVGSVGLLPNSDVPAPSPAFSDRTVSPHRGLKVTSSGSDAIIDNGGLAEKAIGSNTCRVDNKTKNLKSSDVQRSQHAWSPPQYGSLFAQGTSSQVPTQMAAPGMHHSNSAVDHFSHGLSKSLVELQPVLQSISITPPMYATASPYGTPYYPSLQPSSLISSPFGVGGYALNPSLMAPVISGYPPHNAIPIPLDSHVSPNFNARNSGVSTGASIASGVDLQHLYKFYGQLGLIQPSFMDPLYTPYFQHPSVDVYAGAGRYDSVVPGGNSVMSPQGTYDTQVGSSLASYSSDQRPNVLGSGGINTSNAVRGGTISPNYYGSPQNIGVVMQYPNSPLATPMFQGPPGVGTSYTGRKFENVKSPVSSGRSAGVFSGWQGQKGRGKVDEPKPYSFLEELKSNRGRRFELSDIAGHVLVFSADQHGSRFIQQKLETCSAEEKESVFKEVLPHASALMTDVFGNYVIQKFFEHGSPEQRKKLARQLTGHILPLSLQMYGCRVIQKALDVTELEQKTQLVHELDGHVMRCVRDQNGNHVIQKCIECVPTDKIGFIISAFRGQVAALSMHPYGCRVIQRVLEHCTDELQSQCLVDEILQSVCSLAEDQYGNYVTQHVLERGNPHERSHIINKLAGKVVQMSQHKFASNVIEKCLEHGAAAEREILIEEIVGQTEGNDNLLIMMKDQYANYVVQKILETCSDKQRDILLNRIKVHLQALKKYTYGKHIVARVEQLSEGLSRLSGAKAPSYQDGMLEHVRWREREWETGNVPGRAFDAEIKV